MYIYIYSVGDALVGPYPALHDEANYSKNPLLKSIIFRSFLGSSKGRCSALHSEACCSKKPLLKSIISRLIVCPLRGLCIACRNSTTKTQGVRFLGRPAGSSAAADQLVGRPGLFSEKSLGTWEHGNIFLGRFSKFPDFQSISLFQKWRKFAFSKAPPF